MRARVFAALVGLVALASPAELAAADGDSDFLAFSLGAFDLGDEETTAEARIEYRSDRKVLYLGPMAGLMVNFDGGAYVYGGVYLDLLFGRRWVVMPSLAVGAYREGDGKDLGGTLEFRSGVEVSYRLGNGSRIGIAFHHISNAGLRDKNPGAESLVFTYAVPFDTLF
ncbi:MAG: acyloxyacyl hydrolase [Alphaproteobacteria bacterium]